MESEFDTIFGGTPVADVQAAESRRPEEMRNFHLIVMLCVATLICAPVVFGWTAMMWL